MRSYKVSAGSTAVRVKAFLDARSVIAAALTDLMARDPEAIARGATVVNQYHRSHTVTQLPAPVGSPSAEQPTLYLPAVVLERVVKVHGGGACRSVRVPVSDGAVDGGVLLDRFRDVAADRVVQSDRC